MPVIGTYQSLALNLGTGQSTTIMFPKLNAARVYISSGLGLQVCCNSASGTPPSEPIGWTATDPNYGTPFDWAELNWDNAGNAGLGHKTRLGGNVTQVDMFGLPLLLTLRGKSTVVDQLATANAGFTRSFQTMMNAYQALGTPWTQLIVKSGGAPLRVIAPYHGIANGVFPNNALDSYISQVFSFYQSNSLAVQASCGQDGGIRHIFSGSTSGGALVFSEGGTAEIPVLAADQFDRLPKRDPRESDTSIPTLQLSFRGSGGKTRSRVHTHQLALEHQSRRLQCGSILRR